MQFLINQQISISHPVLHFLETQNITWESDTKCSLGHTNVSV